MHLEISQLAPLLCRIGLLSQEVEFAHVRIAFNLTVPVLPIPLGNPFSQTDEVIAREGFDFCLDGFDLSHDRLLSRSELPPLYSIRFPKPAHIDLGRGFGKRGQPGVAARGLSIMLENSAAEAVRS
jgi:hypothetical protein